MEVIIGVLALLFVLFVVLGTYVTVKAVRTVKRGVERTGSQVRQTVEETTLRARGAQPGPVGELARTRLELRSSIDSTRRALESGAASDHSLQEAAGLLDRLHEHARQLDGELRLLMEQEPDKARVAARLPEAREQVARIKQSADSLRFAAQDRARQSGTESLDALREQIEIESGALRHWEHGVPPAAGTHGMPGTETSAPGPGAADPRVAEPGRGEPEAGESSAGDSRRGPEAGAADPRALGPGGEAGGEAGRQTDWERLTSRPDLHKGRPQSAP